MFYVRYKHCACQCVCVCVCRMSSVQDERRREEKKVVKNLTCDHANMPTFKGHVINHKYVATLQ